MLQSYRTRGYRCNNILTEIKGLHFLALKLKRFVSFVTILKKIAQIDRKFLQNIVPESARLCPYGYM